jgi:protein-L-isoaspartate O-methyltransferase
MQNQISFSSEYLGAIPVSLFDPCQKGDFMTYTATYSPDDDKIRIYGPRFDEETYARVKAAGFRWAPKQELWVAPGWSPNREDLAIELAGQIDDEDKSLVQRAEERSERFEDYSDSRMKDAERARKAVSAIADNIPFGQPILVGHHSEKHARADAKRIENGMRTAVNMWKQSGYWADRAAGCLRNAKYKELPAVRARRIKGIEADLRKTEKTLKASKANLKAWSELDSGKFKMNGEPATPMQVAKALANCSYMSFKFPLADYPRDPPISQYEGDMGIWSALDHGIITPEQARGLVLPGYERSIAMCARWIEHYNNRLDYERAMLGEAGGIETDKTKPEKGGAIRSWHNSKGWSYIQKVNKVTVTIWDFYQYSKKPYRANVPFDKVNGIMSAAEVNMAKQGQRVTEFGCGGTVTGFVLMDADLKPEPTVSIFSPSNEGEKSDMASDMAAMQSTLKAGVKVQVVNQLFPTPRDLAQEVADLADIRPGERVLEPSAGAGALLGAMGGRMFGQPFGVSCQEHPELGSVVAVEINRSLAQRLQTEFPLTTVINADFLGIAAIGDFDKILMNPPFENGADIRHIQHALGMLKPGGRLVAICANGPRQQAKLKPIATEWRPLPDGTFRAAGTDVNVAILVIDQPAA